MHEKVFNYDSENALERGKSFWNVRNRVKLQLFDIFPSDPYSHILCLPKWAKLAIRLTSKHRGESHSKLIVLRCDHYDSVVTHGKDPTQPPTVWEKIMIWHSAPASGKPPQISSKINSNSFLSPLNFFALNNFCIVHSIQWSVNVFMTEWKKSGEYPDY